MSSDRETTRIVRSWLEDGVTRLPDRVLDQVFDQLPSTPQRRPWWQAWRQILMNNTLKLVTAAGVVALVFAVGLGLYFGPRQNVAAPPVPSPTTHPSPTVAPSPLSLLRRLNGEDLPAGTYVTDTGFPLQVTFTVPDGWEKWTPSTDATGVITAGDPGTDPRAGFVLWIIDEVYFDPCDPRLAPPFDPGPTVDDLADAFGNLLRHQRTTPREVTLAGYDGKYVEVTARDDCDSHVLWTTPGGAQRERVGTNDRNRLWILDVEGTRLVLMAADNDSATDRDRAQLRQMVESISIEPQPSAEPTVHSLSPRTPATLLEAGTYVVDERFPARVTFTVPAGWANVGVTQDWVGVLKDGGAPPAGAGFGFFIVDNVYVDPCRTDLGLAEPPVGGTVGDLARALVRLPTAEGMYPDPERVTFAGHPGQYVVLNAPDDLSDCRRPRWWSTPYSGRDIFGPSEVNRVWILDVEGTRIVFNTVQYPGTSAADLAELEQIIDSVRIEPASSP